MDITRWPEGSYRTVVMTPDHAKELLQCINTTSAQGVVPWVVDLYTTMMGKGEWKPQSLASEGHPVLVKGGELIYGVQRLLACVRSGIPFDTVLVELPANHQGYY